MTENIEEQLVSVLEKINQGMEYAPELVQQTIDWGVASSWMGIVFAVCLLLPMTFLWGPLKRSWDMATVDDPMLGSAKAVSLALYFIFSPIFSLTLLVCNVTILVKINTAPLVYALQQLT